MVDYREILRLNSLKYTQRQIAASVHSSYRNLRGLTLLRKNKLSKEIMYIPFK